MLCKTLAAIASIMYGEFYQTMPSITFLLPMLLYIPLFILSSLYGLQILQAKNA